MAEPATFRERATAVGLGGAAIVLTLGLQLGSFWPLWHVARGLAFALAIPDDAPVRDHPLGLLWFVAFMATMIAFQILGFCSGLVLARGLVRVADRRGWAYDRSLLGSLFAPGAPGRSKRKRGDLDLDPDDAEAGHESLYDPEIDGPP